MSARVLVVLQFSSLAANEGSQKTSDASPGRRSQILLNRTNDAIFFNLTNYTAYSLAIASFSKRHPGEDLEIFYWNLISWLEA